MSSRLSGWVNPELRAGLDAVLAKWAAPGMCHPADETPVVAGAPSRRRSMGMCAAPRSDGGWRTRKRKDGITEWIPPPHLDRGQRRTNTYFHPEKMP